MPIKFGCPKGKWKNNRCKIGMKSQSLIIPKKINNPIQEKDKVYTNMLGYLNELTVISVKNGKPIRIKFKGDSKNLNVMVLSSEDKGTIIINPVNLRM